MHRDSPRRAGVPLVAVALAAVGLVGVGLWHAAPPPPLWWMTRARLPACPAVTLPQGQALPEATCLFGDSTRETGAEWEVTSLTSEGDPVRTYYRRLPGAEGLEVVVDSSDDSYGSTTWLRWTCTGVTSAAELADCVPPGA